MVLEDISGVTSARYQTFTPPSTSTTTPSVPMTTMLDQVRVGMEMAHGCVIYHTIFLELSLVSLPLRICSLTLHSSFQVAQFSAGVTVAVDENGEVMKTARGDVTSMTLDDPASPSNLSEDLLCRLCEDNVCLLRTM